MKEQRSYALPSHFYGDPSLVVERTQEQQTFEDRIFNWRRVARDRLWKSATCWSAEGRYVAPDDDVAALPKQDAEEARQRDLNANPWPKDPDIARRLIADAWLLETTWRFLPDLARKTLALVYHKPLSWSIKRITVQLGVRRDQYDDTLRKARAMLRNRLRTVSGSS